MVVDPVLGDDGTLYGPLASDMIAEMRSLIAHADVITPNLTEAALLLGEVVDEIGTPNDFVGHPGGDNFIVISHADEPQTLKDRITSRFEDEIKQHYSFIDRERGYMIVPDADGADRQVPLMTISAGSVSARTQTFADIREITELAAEDRRTGSTPVEEYDLSTYFFFPKTLEFLKIFHLNYFAMHTLRSGAH